MNQIIKFQSRLLSWYDKHGRKNLPWQVNNSYLVWISEIMLQQTQVVKVIEYFNVFIKKFPTMEALAQADINNVLALWSGLGYYNRAGNIHKTAQICTQEYNAQLPLDLKQLMALPGIGQTTAGAILSLASNLPFAILDGNVKRVMSRVYKVGDTNVSQYNKNLWKLAEQNLSQLRPKNYNQALMDLGSLVCVRSKPLCNVCPLNSLCQSYQTNETDIYPPKKTKTKQTAVTLHTLLMIKDEKILLRKRSDSGIWAGLWFLPEFNGKNDNDIKLMQRSDLLHQIRHVLSHRVLTINVYKNRELIDQMQDCHWIALSDLNKFAHPSALVKIIIAVDLKY
jgi:A/G-specific adenine glycosylase